MKSGPPGGGGTGGPASDTEKEGKMNYLTLILAVSAALVATKFLDCYSTWSRGTPEMERNRPVRRLMETFGFARVVWGVFALACALVAAGAFWAAGSRSALDKVSFIALGALVAFIQLAVALRNFSLPRPCRCRARR